MAARALRHLWALRKEKRPWRALMALSAHRGDFLPTHVLNQLFLAWQTAFVVSWDAAAGRHRAAFSFSRFLKQAAILLRPLLAGGRSAFHVMAPRSPSAGAPRVLHVIPSLQIGGSEKIVVDIIEGLGERFSMRVLTGRVVRHAHYEGLDATVCETAEEIVADLRRRPADLIHLHYWGLNAWMRDFLAAIDALDLQTPVVGNMNNPIPALMHPKISHHVFVSRFASEIEPRPAGPSSVIYPGSDPGDWLPAGQPPRPYPTLGLVYRLEPGKIDLESIDALIEIVARQPRARIIVPGGGAFLPEFVEKIERAGARANFEFVGWVPYRRLPALYDRFDLYVAPVTAESYGVVVPYAMFKAIPVLAYRTGALPEILEDERWLCSGREEFVERAVEMLGDLKPHRAAAQALKLSSQRFTIATMLRSYEQLYERLLSQKAPRGAR